MDQISTSASGRKWTNASSLSHADGLIGTAGRFGDTDNGVSPTLQSMDDYGQPPGMAVRRAAQAWPPVSFRPTRGKAA